MKWVRGGAIGKGSFGTVNLAMPRATSPQIPPLMAVKSALINNSDSLRNEREILSHFHGCPEIIQCHGDDVTVENGAEFYNLFLEYSTKGSLADRLKKKSSTTNNGPGAGKFTDSEVRRYTKSILKGLCRIHEKGFVHCDIKLQNILLFGNDLAKISDFGLAKRAAGKEAAGLRGTPLYMSPEVVNGGESESPADIWALGCSVVEMITGKSGWNFSSESDVTALFYRIVVGGEVPEIPGSLCEEGKDFLNMCFIKDPTERWTARMLLDHPFISGYGYRDVAGVESVSTSKYSCCGDEDQDRYSLISPRCPLDFPDWMSMGSPDSNQCTIPSFGIGCSRPELDNWERGANAGQSGSRRIRKLASSAVDWSDSDGWVIIR